MLTQQCHLAGKEYLQLLQRSEDAHNLSTTIATEIDHHNHTTPDCSHTINWDGSTPPYFGDRDSRPSSSDAESGNR
eukprot:611922-Karenia_brevis.AAC.1